MKYNQIHKGEERQKMNKQIRKNQMFKKLKKRIKEHMGQDWLEDHGTKLKGKEKTKHSDREYSFNLTPFKTTGSSFSKKKYKDWDSNKRKSEKQKWKRDAGLI